MTEMRLRTEVTRHDMKLARPYAIAGRTIDAVENILVVLRDPRGMTGIGTASPSQAVTGETLDSCEAATAAAAEALAGWRGTLPEALNAPWLDTLTSGAPAARAAVEMAMLDLIARRADVPLVTSLGGAVHHRMPTSVTIGIQEEHAAVEDAQRLLAQGFTRLKIKIGNAIDADVRTLERVSALAGGRAKLRVDPNQGYDPVTLKSFLAATAKLGIELIEQPMTRGRERDLAGIGHCGVPPFAADEDLHSLDDAERLVASNAYDVFNIKLMKCGGVLPALRIADIAERNRLQLMWGCMDESVVSIAAALHAAFRARPTRYLDLDGSLDLASDVAVGGFALDRGDLILTGAPGLGATLISGD